MGVYCKNRVLIISLALAGSGILTCGLALSDIFLPRGSTMVVLASVPLLGIVVLGVLIIFAWTCELVDRRGGISLSRPATAKQKEPWQMVSARGPNLASGDGRRPEPKTSLPARPLVDYPVKLRGTMQLHQGSRRVSGWHGQ